MNPPIPLKSKFSLESLRLCVRTPIAALALATILSGAHILAAQTPATPPPAAAHKPVHPHKRPSPARLTAVPAQATPAPVLPHWPANDKPSAAAVTWDSQGLRIDAANSSLQQILKDVSTATGVKVEGMNEDVRVFGSYGPGPARDVLSQLLHGSGYNVMMIGDQGQGTPRQIVLSARSTGSAPTPSVANAATSNEDEAADNETEEQPQPPAPAVRPNIPPANQTRTPQQIMEEMRERQQQVHSQNPPPD